MVGALCVAVMLAAGCGAVSLPDAKFEIPVPANASLVDTSYADTGEDFMGQFRTVSWTLKSSSPLQEIVAFYEKQLPGAEEDQTEEGVTFLRFVPASAKPKEKIVIFFYSADRIYIEQDTLK